MLEKVCVLDPGSWTMKLYDPSGSQVSEVRTIWAKDENRICFGDQAIASYWRKGAGAIQYPIDAQGIVANVDPVLKNLLDQCMLEDHLLQPSLMVILDEDSLKDKEFWQLKGLEAGFRRVSFARKEDLLFQEYALVIHAGYTSCEIAVYGKKELIAHKKIFFGGQQIDLNIAQYIGNHYKAMLYHEDAAALKEAASLAFWQQRNPTLSCTVFDSRGQYARLSLKALELWPAMNDVIHQIVLWARTLAAQNGVDVLDQIRKHPIYLSGGLANLFGLRQSLEEQLNLPVKVSEHPVWQLLSNAATGRSFFSSRPVLKSARLEQKQSVPKKRKRQSRSEKKKQTEKDHSEKSEKESKRRQKQTESDES